MHISAHETQIEKVLLTKESHVVDKYAFIFFKLHIYTMAKDVHDKDNFPEVMMFWRGQRLIRTQM